MGCSTPSLIQRPSKGSRLFPTAVLSRLVFTPLLKLCSIQNSKLTVLLHHDCAFIIIMALFSFSNRYLVSLCLAYGPQRTAASGLCVLCVFFIPVAAEKVFESRSGVIQELRTSLADLAGKGRAYLGRLVGEQTVLSVQKAFSQVLGVVAESLAEGLNVLLQYTSYFLQAAGIQVGHPINKVTPEGLVFVAQWVLVALICYWLISLGFQLVASTLRRALWLLKVTIALTCFGLILNDHRVGTETMAMRLAVLVCICVVLGVGTWSGSNPADKTARLEEQVKILERRLREMERWTRTEE